MTGWRLEPERVRGVLRTVADKRTDLDDALTEAALNFLVLDVSGGGPLVAAVPNSLTALLNDQAGRLAGMRSRIDAGVVGVGLAVGAYEAGNEEMATDIQTEALAAAESGDLDALAAYLEP